MIFIPKDRATAERYQPLEWRTSKEQKEKKKEIRALQQTMANPKESDGEYEETDSIVNPGVGVRWIYARRKD